MIRIIYEDLNLTRFFFLVIFSSVFLSLDFKENGIDFLDDLLVSVLVIVYLWFNMF